MSVAIELFTRQGYVSRPIQYEENCPHDTSLYHATYIMPTITRENNRAEHVHCREFE